ncbi:MATE family efflux transporter [Photobacterium rosenbergii]|uniref:Multidrug resistance protein NorM n=2 Tax=Photobacterium rosenbergii TaxID=294936 RepID=A0A2T3NF96_9GAMM|nr:MATE family efflux transporter [Photobacterium rosenbergii]
MHISNEIKLIIQRTLPLTMGVLAIMAVQLVDTVFIGMLGVNALNAQGLTLPFSSVIISIQVGIGVAATCLISRYVGEKNQPKANRFATLGLLLGTLAISLLVLSLWFFEKALFTLFIDDKVDSVQMAGIQHQFSAYWGIWLMSALAGAVFYFVSSVYRANQDSSTPGKLLIASSILNLVFDPIFIFVLDMGIAGAALASCLAFTLCAAYMLLKPIAKGWFTLQIFYKSAFEDLRVLTSNAIATTANQFLPAISALVSMYLIARVGPQAIAVWGIAMKMEGLLLVLSLSLTMSIPPIIGSYLGNQQFGDIQQIIKAATKLILLIHTVIALFVMLSSAYLVEVIGGGLGLDRDLHFVLVLLPLSYGPLGLCMVMVSAFNALDLAKRALVVSFIRLFVLFIPAIYLGSLFGNIQSIIIAAAIANTLAGLSAWYLMRKQWQSTEKTMKLIAA